ncbi:MAG TPA: hypothetical protein VFP71_11090 [Candidatus Angelobacter sp.]|nr:hypothetical protein [Candidatus Angelobacter sp.]
MAKRKIFAELMEGIAAMQAQREGNITLCSYKIKSIRLPESMRGQSGRRARA